MPAGQVTNARAAQLGGSPDGASVFNAGDGTGTGTGVVTGSPGADWVLGGGGGDDVGPEGEGGNTH